MTPPSADQLSKIELLSPAGCYASAQAAIAAGADALYFGISQLNMRARARRSFDEGDIAELAKLCHDSRVKGYLTLNTLLYDHDLALARKLLERAAESKIDGVIASDIAAIQIARELGLEVHISTQMSVSNYETVKFHSQWSDRVVLARELNLRLIRKIYDQIVSDDLRGPSGRRMEIEAFAHGAQCIAVSGRCGMSLYTDNASANRGACQQNCRRRYHVTDAESGEVLEIDNEYVMSPNDICTIDFLDQFVGAGVRVLKIEGRGRAPEYVGTVTRVYREALSSIADGSYAPEKVERWLEELATVYNRGFASGYYLGRKQGWSRSSGSEATRRRVEVGTVVNYFARPKVAHIRSTAKGLQQGDEYVIVGDTTGALQGTASELRVDEQTVESVPGKSEFTMPVATKVRTGDRVYLLERNASNPT